MCLRPARELISVDTENWNSFRFVVCSNCEAPLRVFLIGIIEVKRYYISGKRSCSSVRQPATSRYTGYLGRNERDMGIEKENH